MPIAGSRAAATPITPLRCLLAAVVTPRLAVALLLAHAAATRILLLTRPGLVEANYEEALVGLMARRILEGDLVTFWWGHPYLGAGTAYTAAPLFALGPATTLVLRLVPLLCSLAAALLAYWLARTIVGPWWALVALGWWAVPPAALLHYSVIPYEYLPVVALGTLALACTHRAGVAPAGATRAWAVAGLAGGVALWEHVLAFCYVAASGGALVAWLRRRRAGPAAGARPRLRASAAWAGGLLLGSAPLWVWNVRHGFETFTEMIQPSVQSNPDVVRRLARIATELAPQLLGAWETEHPLRAAAASILYGPVLVLGLASLVDRPGGGPGPGAAARRGIGLLLTLAGLAGAQMWLTHYDQSRYLMPIYSAAPVLVAVGARWLARRAAWLAGLLLAGLLLLHAADGVALARALGSRPGGEQPAHAVVAWLDQQAIRHVSGHFRVVWPIWFASEERIVAADFTGNPVKTTRRTGSGVYETPLLDALVEVALARRAALVTHEDLQLPTAAQMEETLRLLGGTHTRHRIGPYTLFYDFWRPVERVREIPAAAIRVRATDGDARAALVLDGSLRTGWRTAVPSPETVSLELRFDRPRRVACVVLEPGDSIQDYPRRLHVARSDDGIRWRPVLTAAPHMGVDWLGAHPRFNSRGRIAVWLPPGPTLALRLSRIGPVSHARWTVSELFAYEEDPAADAGRDLPAPATMLAALRAHAVQAAYSTAEGNLLLARVRDPGIRTIPVRESRFVEQSPRMVHFKRRNGFLLPGPAPALEAALARRGVPVEAVPVERAVLYVTAPRAGPGPLYWDDEHLLEVDRAP